ncbi:MAG: HAD hydrolase-like protein [Candidatus Tectomicrobia bacterium]|nr:HAD hydrolase-like protein [Candidatus Tectomicrobia bacterium]
MECSELARHYDVLLFDLDGTLSDSKAGIINSIQYALEKFHITEDDHSKLQRFIGPPLLESFRTSYQFDEFKAKQAVEYYREYYSTKGIYEGILYDGIPDLLRKLYRKKKMLIVATSKPTPYARRVLNHFALDKFFTSIVGSHLDGTRSSKKEVIECIVSDLTQVSKRHVVMIGDRDHDVRGAHANGIDSIAVTYGYGALEEIENAGPTYIVNSVHELSLKLDEC